MHGLWLGGVYFVLSFGMLVITVKATAMSYVNVSAGQAVFTIQNRS